MSDRRKLISDQGGFFENIANHLKLVWRLLFDERVGFMVKLIPIGSLLYFIFPFDIPGPIDDVAVLWGATHIFVEMCPPQVVAEHRAEIERIVSSSWREPTEIEINPQDIIDAEYEEK